MRTVSCRDAAIPALGFGTWKVAGEAAPGLIAAALDAGYRHIDTAQAYANEAEVGAGLAQSSVPRDQVFVTTKIWPDNFAPNAFSIAVEASLARLKTDYVDLLLLHWPNFDVPLADTMGALVKAREAGQAKHIGVSNFPTDLLAEADALSGQTLVNNQVEYHVFLDQTPLLTDLRARDMSLTAYSPIAQGKVGEDPVVGEIAAARGVSPYLIALAWLVSQDKVIAIPRSLKLQNAEANLAALEITLSAEEMARLSALGSDAGRLVDPSWAPRWDRASAEPVG